MQYNVTTPIEYLSVLEDDWRKKVLLQIRDIIKDFSPKILEGIEYKMLRYGDEHSSIFHLNAQKNFVGLYVGSIGKIDESGELLQGLEKGKGCIRIKKSTDISKTRLDEFIRRAIEIWKSGGDTSC